MILSLAMLLSWTLKNPYTVCKLCNIKRVKNRHATTLNSLCCEVWSHSEVGEHLHGLVFNVSFSRDENKKIFFFFFFLSNRSHETVHSCTFFASPHSDLNHSDCCVFVYGVMKGKVREGDMRVREREREYCTVILWSERSLRGYKERWHVWLHLCLIEFTAPLS